MTQASSRIWVAIALGATLAVGGAGAALAAATPTTVEDLSGAHANPAATSHADPALAQRGSHAATPSHGPSDPDSDAPSANTPSDQATRATPAVPATPAMPSDQDAATPAVPAVPAVPPAHPVPQLPAAATEHRQAGRH